MDDRVFSIPGLVDLQVNGYGGVDFSDPGLTGEMFTAAARRILDCGATAFLPTVVTVPEEIYRRILPLIADVMDTPEFRGRIPGIHIEGPFIARAACGAHNASWIHSPDPDLLDRFVEWSRGRIRMVTVAPEVESADRLIRRAVEHGITVSIGHSMAAAFDVECAVEAGARAMTHLGNGIPGIIPRHDNPIWSGLSDDRLTVMMITDGHHLPPPVIKTFVRAKGAARCVVTSDASPSAGLEPGEYTYMGVRVVLEKNGLLHNPAQGNLAGSSSTMMECMNHLASLDLMSPDELVQVCYYNPLKLIGVDTSSVRSTRDVVYDMDERRFSFAG